MKKLFLLFFVTTYALADAPVFTTLGNLGEDVYAGVKKIEKDHEPETWIMHINAKQVSSKVQLPKELIHREVVGLFPAKDQLVVLTQRTVEQGDKPVFHRFDPKKKTWSKLAESECVSFAKLNVTKDAVEFNCIETDKKGEEIEVKRKTTLKGVTLTSVGDTTLPVTKASHAQLVGEAFEWQEIKVGNKTFKP